MNYLTGASKSGKHILFNSILILIAAFILFLGLTQNLNIYDEGLAIIGGQRVLDGELPYKDFWTMYSPGQFYLLAGAFKLFGQYVITERVLTILLFLGMGWIWLLIASKIHEGRSKYVTLMVLAAWVSMIPLFGRAIPTSLLFCYLSGYFLFRHFDTRDFKTTVFAGLALGMAALFRHDIAGFLFGAIFQAVFFFSLSEDKVKGLKLSKRIVYGLKMASGVILGLTPYLIPLFMLLGSVGFDLLWQNLIYMPWEIFGDYRELPFPNPLEALNAKNYPFLQFWKSILFYIPITIFLVTIIGIIYRTKKKIIQLNGRRFWIEITAFNFGINLLNTAMVRSDLEHTLPAWTGALLCLLVIFDWIKKDYKRGVVTVLSLLFIGGYPLLKMADHIFKLQSGEKILIPEMTLFPASADKKFSAKYLAMAEIIDTKLEDGDFLYSGVFNHTDFVVNDVMIYHLTDTRPAVYFHELHPGVSTGLLAQNLMMKDLQEIEPKMVVLADFGSSNEPNKSSKIKTSDIITPYIRSHYTKVSKFGDYILYVRDSKIGELPL